MNIIIIVAIAITPFIAYLIHLFSKNGGGESMQKYRQEVEDLFGDILECDSKDELGKLYLKYGEFEKKYENLRNHLFAFHTGKLLGALNCKLHEYNRKERTTGNS